VQHRPELTLIEQESLGLAAAERVAAAEAAAVNPMPPPAVHRRRRPEGPALRLPTPSAMSPALARDSTSALRTVDKSVLPAPAALETTRVSDRSRRSKQLQPAIGEGVRPGRQTTTNNARNAPSAASNHSAHLASYPGGTLDQGWSNIDRDRYNSEPPSIGF
jgi:hypothetical protein